MKITELSHTLTDCHNASAKKLAAIPPDTAWLIEDKSNDVELVMIVPRALWKAILAKLEVQK